MLKAIQSLRAGERGYTLVELLVVLTIISLLVAAAPAIVSAARPGAEVRTAAYGLVNALRAARAAAIVADADRSVVLDLDNKMYLGADGKTHRLPDGARWKVEEPLASAPERAVQLRFFSDGSSSGGRVRISGAGRDYLIVDHGLTGRISIDE